MNLANWFIIDCRGSVPSAASFAAASGSKLSVFHDSRNPRGDYRRKPGIISIPIEHQPEFTRMLVDFYESDNMDEIKDFVYENGIDGIDFRQNEC